MRRLLALIGLLALATAAHAAGISILQKDGDAYTNPTPPPPYAKILADNGFNLGFPTTEMRAIGKLTPELMKQYNVVVVPSMMGWATDQKPAELGRYLDDYLKSGGGVLLFQLSFLEGIPLFEAQNAWLKPYGAAFRWEELVGDDAHKYANPPDVPWQAPFFFWTDAVAKSPLTQDVKQVFWVPGVFRGPHMTGLDVDKSWQVLLSAPETTQHYQVTYDKANEYGGRVKDAPPTTGPAALLAVRQVGKGRLAIFGGSPATFWYDLGKPVYAGVPQERGDGARKSDWQPLLLNVLRWLGEPAQKAGKPGGYAGQVQFTVRPDYGNRKAIDWEKVDQEGVSPELVQQTLSWHSDINPPDWKDWEDGKYKPFKLLLGAKTALSGGKGSVADWKTAAVAAGYSGVIFREDIYRLTAEQWTAFRKDCDAASDKTFRAIPGQEYEDWIGNKFMHFTGDLNYPPHLAERSTDGKMRDQLSYFCDQGWPVRLPLSVKNSPTEFWNYRLTYGWPLYVYDAGGKLTEENQRTWEELVDSYETPQPLAVHLMDDPAQVPQAATGAQTYALATSLPTFNGRDAGLFYIGNDPRIFTTTGPMIDNFHCLNMFRTTLGSRDVAGSYRYRIWIKAHSAKPIARVELWGGDEPLRIYRPLTTEFSTTVDELHDRQRALFLKVVDVDGGEARMTGSMVHDKMLEFVWCGDLENALPYGLGTDEAGNVFTIGIGTRVKSSFQGIDGPGTDGMDMWRYVPWGTDTSAPAVGLLGDPRLYTDDGTLPTDKEWYTSRVTMPYASRDIMFERLTATRLVNWQDYVPKHQPTINGWYPFTKNHDTTAFDLVHDDVEFHRIAGVPALQWSTGTMTFKQDVTLSAKQPLNVFLARVNSNMLPPYAYTSAGEVGIGTNRVLALGRGGFITWPGKMGHVTVFALDDDFAVHVTSDATRVWLDLGYNFPGRKFSKGEKFTYQLVTMRWPSGMPLSDRLDVRVAAALNLADRGPAYTVAATRGQVKATQLFLDLQADKGVFAGSVNRAWLGTRIPARLWGLNHRWTACVWRPDVPAQILAPLAPQTDDQAAYFSLDLEKEPGALFVGSVVTCDQPSVWIRVLQRSDGAFDVVVHNPGEQALTVNLQGETGGPLAGWKQTVQLVPGAEERLKGIASR